MFITYTPEDEPAQEYEVRMGRIRSSRAALIQKVYSKAVGEKATWEQFKLAVLQGDIIARRVMLWQAMTDTHATLRFEDTPDFCDDELLVENSRQELADLRPGLERAPMDEAQRQMMLAALDEQTVTAREDGGGKAPSTTSGGDTD